jgi:hypothetical protein
VVNASLLSSTLHNSGVFYTSIFSKNIKLGAIDIPSRRLTRNLINNGDVYGSDWDQANLAFTGYR